jgi:ABC-type uncharacterized transport system involved in gliding motility auxiliary subunit
MTGGLAGLALVLVIIVAVNIVVGNVSIRKDFTDEQLYTLSDGTRKILSQLEEPVTLKLFFNKSYGGMPTYLKNYARQVEDLLKEYKIGGRGNIILEIYDPKPDSDAEDMARRYGVSQRSVEVFGPPVYFGLVATLGDVEGALPALDPRTEGLLEYNVTRLIHRLSSPDKPVIGVMSSMPVLGQQAPQPGFGMPPQAQQQPWMSMRELQEDYDVRNIAMRTTEIPEDVKALVIVHPKGISQDTLYAIDQFILHGGHVLAFVDPFSVTDFQSAPRQQMYAPQVSSSDLGPLLQAWGIGFDNTQLIADMKAVTRFGGQLNQVEESPILLTLRRENVSEDIITSQLESLLLPMAGSFKDNTTDDLELTALVKTSDMAGNVPAAMAQFGSEAVMRDFKPAATPSALAIRVSGMFKTAYPDGNPSDEADRDEEDDEDTKSPDENDEAEGLSSGESTVILVADSDMIEDSFCVRALNIFGTRAYQPLNDNVAFFANAVEQMAGSSDLIGIRSRGESARPFDRVLELEQIARQEWQDKEKQLIEKLQEAQRQLRELQDEKDQGQRLILSPEQQAAIKRFQEEELRINRELKDVRKNLRRDIEKLGLKVKLANIALMPIIVALGGVIYGLRRKNKR